MSHEPVATLSQAGIHNDDLDASRNRLERGASYKDLSMAVLVATRGTITARVFNAWWGLMAPMNHAHYHIVIENCEVADAYNEGVNLILNSPGLNKVKFILTLEEDNVPPPDGAAKLAGDMYLIDDPSGEMVKNEETGRESPKQINSPYAGIGGLYWTKGPGGMPMIYGDPTSDKVTFEPQQVIDPLGVQECNGIAMGFTIYETELFRDRRLEYEPKKWFRTLQEYEEYKGVSAGTQDLDFCARAKALGYRFAVDTRIKVGHWDQENQVMW